MRDPRASRRVLLGAFGDPGHAFPMIALGRALRGARPRRHAADLGRWQASVEAEGMAFAAAPEYHVFPTGVPRAARLLRGGRPRHARHAAARARAAPGRRSSRTSSRSPRRSPPSSSGIPRATLDPPRLPRDRAGLSDLLARRAPAAHRRSAAPSGAAPGGRSAAASSAAGSSSTRPARASACRRWSTSTAASAASWRWWPPSPSSSTRARGPRTRMSSAR